MTPSTKAEAITVSLDVAERMKEAGWEQDNAIWKWRADFNGKFALVSIDNKYCDGYAAPTAEEILRELPDGIEIFIFNPSGYHKRFQVKASKINGIELPDGVHAHVDEHHTFANAAGEMYIYLAKNNLLTNDSK